MLEGGLRKKHGLQGPIDDAFMNGFVFVRPTGTPAVPGDRKWVEAEQNMRSKSGGVSFGVRRRSGTTAQLRMRTSPTAT